MLPYIVPFAIYIVASLAGDYFQHGTYIMYPIKTVLVAASLWFYRKEYTELRAGIRIGQAIMAIGVGIFVLVVWVLPDDLYPHLGASEFNPQQFNRQTIRWTLIAFRLAGAALVVPVFEELFWRSFVMRWIINPDFKQVDIGKFTWMSFIVVTVFFGLEHHRWLVGFAAGLIYNLLLYRERNLWACIVSHGVTNFALGIYVLQSERWSFW